LGVGEGEVVLLFVGNDFKLKGLSLLLEAMAVLRNEKIRLMVAGEDDRASYVRWARKHGLERQVLFLGGTREVEKFYAASDLFVLPTRYDAFSNVCLEAMACGTPVITSRNNGASELIRNGEEGYTLESLEGRELAETIRLSLSAEKRASMGERAAVKSDGFSMEKHFAALLRLYEEVMSLKGR
jgi:UDP-glucose:(heptosyl)LPS alpha-1,3-glucosyltransferase